MRNYSLVRSMQRGFIEGERKEYFYAFNDTYAGGAVEEDAHGLSIALLYLNHDLSAGAARSCRHGRKSLFVARGNGYGINRLFGPGYLCGENGSTLCTESYGIDSILLVGTKYLYTIFESYTCSYLEMAIVGIATPCGLNCFLNESLVVGRQFFWLTEQHFRF